MCYLLRYIGHFSIKSTIVKADRHLMVFIEHSRSQESSFIERRRVTSLARVDTKLDF